MLKLTNSQLLVVIIVSWPVFANAASPKYSADVPGDIITPNEVDSKYLGKLNYIDGAPTEETYSKSRDFVDTANAVNPGVLAT